MDRALVDYIVKEKKRGFSSEQIKNALVKAGHDVQIVEENLNHVFKEAAQMDKKKVLIVSLVVFVLVISVGFYYYSKTTTPEDRSLDYINLGWSLYEQEKFEEAIGQFNNAIELDPDNNFLYRDIGPYTGLGYAYFDLKEYDNAIINLEKAIELNPNNANAHLKLGDTYYWLGIFDISLDYFKKSIELDPDNFGGYCGVGWIFLREGGLTVSKENFNICLDKKKDMEGYLGLALVNFEEKRYDLALEQVNSALEFEDHLLYGLASELKTKILNNY